MLQLPTSCCLSDCACVGAEIPMQRTARVVMLHAVHLRISSLQEMELPTVRRGCEPLYQVCWFECQPRALLNGNRGDIAISGFAVVTISDPPQMEFVLAMAVLGLYSHGWDQLALAPIGKGTSGAGATYLSFAFA